MKECTACKQVLPLDYFKDYGNDVYAWACISCQPEKIKIKVKTEVKIIPLKTEKTLFEITHIPERLPTLERQPKVKKKHISTPQEKLKAKYSGIVKRAQVKQVPVTMTIDILQDILQSVTECPICHVVFTSDNPASIDRIIPQLGYVPQNIAIICKHCNTIKNDATVQQLEAIVKWLHHVLPLS